MSMLAKVFGVTPVYPALKAYLVEFDIDGVCQYIRETNWRRGVNHKRVGWLTFYVTGFDKVEAWSAAYSEFKKFLMAHMND